MPDQNQPADQNLNQQPQVSSTPPVLTVEETPPMPNPPSPPGGGPPSDDIAAAIPQDVGGATPPLDIPPVITPAPTRRRFGGKTVATILGLLVLLGGLGAGLILVRQRQNVQEKAQTSTPGGSCTGCGDPQPCSDFNNDLNACRNTDGCVEDFGKCSGTHCRTNCATRVDEAGCKGTPGCSWSVPVCDLRWPSDPSTTCGQTGFTPANNATGISLTPSFHWNYGGYRPGETGCTQPSNCSSYLVDVYLYKGTTNNASSVIGFCPLGPASSPINDAPFSCFQSWDPVRQIQTGKALAALDPNTDYVWAPTPKFPTGESHTGFLWYYHFKTGGGTTTTGQCQNIQAFDTSWTKITNLSTLKAGDKVRFTTAGTATAGSFDKARFTINGTLRPEVTSKKPTTGEFYDEYTVPTGVTNFTVKAEVHHTTLGWL